jgi:hypothetical protein
VEVELVLLVELERRPEDELRLGLVEPVREELFSHLVGRRPNLLERPLVVEVGVHVRQQHHDLHAGVLEVHQLVRRQEVPEVEHAGGLVADVHPLALGVLGQLPHLRLGHDFRRVPSDALVGVHTPGDSARRVKRCGSV